MVVQPLRGRKSKERPEQRLAGMEAEPKRSAFWFSKFALRTNFKANGKKRQRMPLAGAANCFRSNLKGMDAGVNNSMGFALQNPQPKNSMDAVFRQRKG
jgi:hypothetical protein